MAGVALYLGDATFWPRWAFAMFALMAFPYILRLIAGMLVGVHDSPTGGLGALETLVEKTWRYLGPLVSPFHYFGESTNPLGSGAFGDGASWGSVLLTLGLIFLMGMLFIEASIQIVKRRIRD